MDSSKVVSSRLAKNTERRQENGEGSAMLISANCKNRSRKLPGKRKKSELVTSEGCSLYTSRVPLFPHDANSNVFVQHLSENFTDDILWPTDSEKT